MNRYMAGFDHHAVGRAAQRIGAMSKAESAVRYEAAFAPQPASMRYASVDALRGLIMIIMAIDHASGLIARQHGAEFWAGAMSAYHSWFPFLTRWITHVCAPGFFFLMGAGIYWSAMSAPSMAAAMLRTVFRGLVLFATAQLLETPLMFLQGQLQPAKVSLNRITAPPPIDGSALWWGFIVVAALGLVMAVCGLMLRLRPWMWLAVSAACVVATNSLLPASGKPGPLWMTLLLAPGISQHLLVLYPVIPWLAGAAGGMFFAHWWKANPEVAERRVWVFGAVVVALG
jgi:uncharacterized membrane protein